MRAPEQLQLCVLRGIKENSEYSHGRAQTGAIQKSDPNIGMAVYVYRKVQITVLIGKQQTGCTSLLETDPRTKPMTLDEKGL